MTVGVLVRLRDWGNKNYISGHAKEEGLWISTLEFQFELLTVVEQSSQILRLRLKSALSLII